MRRRDFIPLIGGAVAWPLAARAQRPGIPVIGFLGKTTQAAMSQWTGPFEERLSQLGWVRGHTVMIEYRYAEARPERYAEIASEFVRLPVDTIVTTVPAVPALKAVTSVIPIVFALATDPVGGGLIASLARPGGNVTGLSQLALDLSAKRVELLKQAAPNILRVAVLVNPSDEDMARRSLEESRTAADPLQVSVEPVEARTPSDLPQAFSFIIANKFDGLIVTSHPMFFNERGRIAEWPWRTGCRP